MKQYEKEVLQAQLDSEKKVLKDLKKHYQEALNSINEKIKLLQADELTQSKIYQVQYQQVLKSQISTFLDLLQGKEFDSIEEYLKESYNNGYMGALYSIQQQGIPLVLPMDQEQIVKAIQLDSKLSHKLYEELGYNIKTLKKQVRAEVSRGVSTGLMYSDIARNVANVANMDLNKTMRIARTEGHRVQTQAASDAQWKAKDKGCDIVKQWDASLDGRTRASHRMVDGEIVELGDDREKEPTFSNGLRFPSDPRGKASEVVNCRCALLQRARWALDEEELETLKERAKELGVYDEKEQTFEEYKKKYLKASEQERNNVQKTNDFAENERITKNIKFAVEKTYINSREYSNKFDKLTSDADLKREMLSEAKMILSHRSGSNGEDLVLYNTVKKKWFRSTVGTEAGTPEYTDEIIYAIKNSKKGELIAFHNHPASMPPSASDINSALKNGYKKGYALCHNGKIYEYTPSDELIDISIYEMRIAKCKKMGYNEFEAQVETMKHLSTIYGFDFREVE